MKAFNTLSISILLVTSLSAQSLVSVDGDLNFPATNELQASTQTLRLYNPNSYPISVEAVDRFEIYGNKVFSLSDSIFTVMPSDTFSLTVSFLPEHNIQHEQVLVFRSTNGFGHTAVGLSAQGTYSKSYYSTTQNKEQQALKNALNTRLAQGYSDQGYNGARDLMYGSIDNVGGQVECVYTGRTATFNTRSGANNNSFNCEHTFPQGFFNSNVPMRSDIHHLFPTDATANSRRGNDPFGVVGTVSWTQGGSKSGGGKFEPRDAHKGAVARAMMYFVIRYQDYAGHFSGQETILRQWHDQFPPSAAEQARNTAIYNVQNNRNPFVDYPQFIERISDVDGTASAADRFVQYYSDDTIFLAQGPALTRTYSFVIYNDGNKDMGVDNLALSDPDLNFSSATPTTFLLSPGDYQVIEIEFQAQKNYQASMAFRQLGDSDSITIPIFSGPALSLLAFADAPSIRFYPNPVKGLLQVQSVDEITSLQMIDAAGSTHALPLAEQIDLSAFAPGVYTLIYSLKSSATRHQERIIIQ